MVYAKVLLLNKHCRKRSEHLSQFNILPLEGANVERELYREAKLMQAIGQMQNKKLYKRMSFINDAKNGRRT